MVRISTFFMALLAVSACSATPVEKRIAQTISASTQLFEQACVRNFSLTSAL
jgi:hypothetical protein